MPGSKGIEEISIFADGGSRGNPGPSGVGIVIFDRDNRKVGEISRYIGKATNNIAEYLAVIYALQEAVYLKARKVELNIDSQLVAKQLRGEYRVKDENIRKYFEIALNLFRIFDKLEIREVPREENRTADALVNKAINLKSLV